MLDFFFGNNIFGALGRTTMSLKKSSQDTTDKGILTASEAQVATTSQKLALAHDDSTSVMTKSMRSSMDKNGSVDDHTLNTKK